MSKQRHHNVLTQCMYYLKLFYEQLLACLKWEIGNMFIASKEQSLYVSVC